MNDLRQAVRAEHEMRQPRGLARQPEYPADAGPPEVAVHEQHGLARLPERQREADRGHALALAGDGRGHEHDLLFLVDVGQQQAGAQGADILGKRRLAVIPVIAQGAGVPGLDLEPRQDAERGQTQLVFHGAGVFQGVIQRLDQDGAQHREQQAQDEGDLDHPPFIGFGRPRRDHGRVHHARMGGLNIADRAGLLVAAQKGLVDAAVGLDIALQRDQLAGAAVDLVHVAPGLAHGPVQVGLLGQQHLVVLFQRLDHVQGLLRHVFLGGAEFGDGRDHLRVFGAIALFEFGDLALGRGSGALDPLQARVAQHGRYGFIGRRGPALQGHDLAIGGLGRGAIPAHVHQLAGQFV